MGADGFFVDDALLDAVTESTAAMHERYRGALRSPRRAR